MTGLDPGILWPRVPVQAVKGETPMQKIRPWLWFDHEAEEAANFYVSIFRTRLTEPPTATATKGPARRGR